MKKDKSPTLINMKQLKDFVLIVIIALLLFVIVGAGTFAFIVYTNSPFLGLLFLIACGAVLWRIVIKLKEKG